MYDIIGDLHGNFTHTEKLLLALGYFRTKGSFKHRTRKAIFVGDYIDKGPQSKECVQLVRDMVIAGNAIAIPGNHEFNFLCYHKKDEHGKPLRPHTMKNQAQIKDTMESYEGYEFQLEEDLLWFQFLPIYFEHEAFRVIHAAWISDDIEFIHSNYPENCLTDRLLLKASKKDTMEFLVVENLLKGPEVALPEGISFKDNSGHERNQLRVKWWEDPIGKTIFEMAARPASFLPHKPFTSTPGFKPYNKSEKSIFFGHYCLRGTPVLQKSNVCCVDYCVYKTQKMFAYRWEGERTLRETNLVTV
jgi:hypothetical protein